ncbi:NAD(P)-binding Rossmann-fold superfamily protein [Euphorbia peplus]|nr:NAD(P)-binding Rossmann-fold superfamily protein [Euphorbia peplus]
MEEEKGTVCVTGGTGFLASWLIMKLLQHGYSVHTTIRPDPEPGHKRDVGFLTNLLGAMNKLKIFEADLNEPQSFKSAIEGCIGVFHVATPVDFEEKEPEEQITKRAIDGTLGILRACLESKTVKRVVYTSSASAVQFSGKQGVDLLDESVWSDVEFIRSLGKFSFGPYMISKTLTERRALEFGEQHGLDVVSVIPSFINGPFICPKFPGSVHTSLAMILGERDQYEYLLNFSMVHTDDVARAHIFLFEYGEAKGRYICSSQTITIEDMSKFLSTNYSEFSIPTMESLSDVQGFRSTSLTSNKLLDSGFEFKYGLKEMFDGAIQSCKAKGYL